MTPARAVSEEIPQALDGERLDKVVSFLADVSRAVASRLVAEGAVRVDGEIAASGKLRLEAGQLVEVTVPDSGGDDLPHPEPDVPVAVVHDDADIIVVDKQADLVVHPAPGHPGGTLVNGLLARYPEIAGVGEPHRPGIVHRLDAGTSGLMVVARTESAYGALVDAIADREVGRIYWALVWGHPEASSAVIDAPVGRNPRDPTKMAVRSDGKPARTAVDVLRKFSLPAEVALVECRLETGRTHQIRVHLAAIGHPVLGDAVYGGARSAIRCPRPMLHSHTLTLAHPSTGEELSWTSELPADMSGVLASLA